MTDYIKNIAQKFAETKQVQEINPLGNGNINQTFLVTTSEVKQQYFVLQQINTSVFPNPVKVMDNLQLVSNHVRHKLDHENKYNWQIPQVLLTAEQKHHYVKEDGTFWRAISYVAKADSHDTITSLDQAEEIGRGLGIFHRLVSDIDLEKLTDTLPGFHITPGYLAQYQQALQINSISTLETAQFCHQFIQERSAIVDTLEKAKADRILPIRPIHGDPKVNNIMLDRQTRKAIAMVDLDTVKPGLIHYDIGDCLRSGCNKLGEETLNWQEVEFDLELAAKIIQGYLEIVQDIISAQEKSYIYNAVRLISFELGLRFFTDYLNGNIYFKTTYPEQNLNRALVQFQLTSSIESQEAAIRKLLD